MAENRTEKCLLEYTESEFEELAKELDVPGYRIRQLQHWLYRSMARSYDEMRNMPLALRRRLAEVTRLNAVEPVWRKTSRDGTVKVLFSLVDGKTVEAALMLYDAGAGRARNTVCVSTQVGCAIGCPFCATGSQGLERNLSSGEIVDQVLWFARYLRDEGSSGGGQVEGSREWVTNVVFMGMGEPLVNFEAVMSAVDILNSPGRFGLGARNMVVSTAGMVPRIYQLAGLQSQIGLAVSLHAPDNALRDWLVPLNKRYPLEQLIPACREYTEKTGRRISFEYALFRGINDSSAHAGMLAELVRGMNCHINLIPANQTGDRRFLPPLKKNVVAFQEQLQVSHITCTVRESRGADIDAACGQLRSRYQHGNR